MPITLSSSIPVVISDLHDVSISTPHTGQYLRYDAAIPAWQNSYLNTDLYNFLESSLTSTNGITLTKLTGPQTINIGLATVISAPGTFGSSTQIPVLTVDPQGRVTAIATVATVPVPVGTTTMDNSSYGIGALSMLVGAANGVSNTAIGVSALGADTDGSRNTAVGHGSALLNQLGNDNTVVGNYSLPANVIGTGNTIIGSQAATTMLGNGNVCLGYMAGSALSIGDNNVIIGGASGASIDGTDGNIIISDGVGNEHITINSSGLVLIPNNLQVMGGITGDVFGSATSAFGLQYSRVLASTGDADWLVLFDGTSDVSSAITLASVNVDPRTDEFRKITVNEKGLVTATSAVSNADIITSLGYTPINNAGGTMTGALLLNADPTLSLGAATKQYVDTMALGVSIHASCDTTTTTALPSSTYDNGTAGVGATLTSTTLSVLGTIGGYAGLIVGNRVLVKSQASPIQNGIYTVTDLGAAGVTAWILTRASDFDGTPTSEVKSGVTTYVQNGTLAGTQWAETNIGTGAPGDYIIVGTDNIAFTQISGAATLTSGTGINIASNVVSNTGVTSLIAGTNIAVSGATGDVTVSITGTVASATTAGTATTASTLVTSRNINGVGFNGSADITVTAAANTLSGTTLAPGVTTSSLTSVGTLSALTVSGSTKFENSDVRFKSGPGSIGYGVLPYNNGSNFYLLTTNSGSADSTFNSLRPLSFNLATGAVIIGEAVTATGGVFISPLALPTIPTGTPFTTGGTMPATTTYARIVACDINGKYTLGGPESSGVVTTTGTSSITWTWAAVPSATSYRVYVGPTGAQVNYFATSATSYTQIGPSSTGTSAALPIVANSGSLTVAGSITSGEYITSQFMAMTHASATNTADTVFYSSSDNYLRKNTATGLKTSLALQNVTNESKATMLTNPAITAQATISGASTFLPASTSISAATGSSGALVITAQGSAATAGAAFLSFHRPNQYAVHLGLDTDSKIKVGGWSLGANSYELFHAGNTKTVNGNNILGTGNINVSSPAVTIVSGLVQQAITGGAYALINTTLQPASTNICLWSNAASNAVWAKSGYTVTSDITMAPDGTMTADKLVESAIAEYHYETQLFTVLANQQWTVSRRFKAAGRNTFFMLLDDTTWTSGVNALFNLSTGTVSSIANVGPGSGATASLTYLGNGWYEARLSGLISVTATTIRVVTYINTAAIYTGDGTSGLYVADAQLEVGTTASSRIYTEGTSVTRVANVIAPSRIVLPFTPSANDTTTIVVGNGIVGNVIDPNGSTIMGTTGPLNIDTINPAAIHLQYINNTWRLM